MAFVTSMFFIAAYDDGGAKYLFKQLEPAFVEWDASSSAWVASGASLHHPNDMPVFGVDSTALNALFAVVRTGVVGGATQGTVDLIESGLDASPVRDALLATFLEGGRVKLQVSVDGAGVAELAVELRALKTTNFLLDNNQLVPAHHGAVVPANNLDVADVSPVNDSITSYTVALADGGGYSLTLEPGGMTKNALTMDATGHAPANPATRNLSLTVTHSSYAGVSRLPVDLHVPTELVVLVDRSGSMGAATSTGLSKWAEAVNAANLFSRLYGQLVPSLSVPNGSLVGHNTISLGYFFDSGAPQVSFLPGHPVAAATMPQYSAGLVPGGATPIGVAVDGEASPGTVAGAVDQFTSSKWKQRHILLLTDGMDNTGTPRLNDLTVSNPPSVATDPVNGVIIHNISYTLPGDVNVADIAQLVSDHDGFYDDVSTSPQALSVVDLKDMFLSVLSKILPVEKADALSFLAIPAETGIERAVFVATEPTVAGTHLTASIGGNDVSSDADESADIAWVSVDAPVDGTYAIGNVPPGASVFGLYDLTLRTRFAAEAPGLGQPIKLVAEIWYHGAPVTGADVRAIEFAPAESMGEILSNFARNAGLTRAVRHQVLDPKSLGLAVSNAIGVNNTVDVKSVQRQLLEALQKERNLEFQHVATAVVLKEAVPGRYEVTIPALKTQNENVYTFKFRATGITPEGCEFQRNHRLSVVLPPLPEPSRSSTTVVNVASAGAPPKWLATVFPKTATGKPLGPGLVPQLSFQYVDAADRKRLVGLAIVDNLDGTYQSLLPDHTDQLPKLALFWGSPERGGIPIVVAPEGPRLRNVQIRLRKILVIDDKDPLFKGAGELVVNTVVGPNGSPSRFISTRLPATGYYSVSSGDSLEIDEVIYSGRLEEGAVLSVAVTGEELDWPHCFDRNDHFTRYIRRFAIPKASVEMTPEDEPSDPESLQDWKLWFSIEVDS